MAEIGTATVRVIPQVDGVELVETNVLDQLAAAARKHQVMVSITVTPYEDTSGSESA